MLGRVGMHIYTRVSPPIEGLISLPIGGLISLPIGRLISLPIDLKSLHYLFFFKQALGAVERRLKKNAL